MNIIVIIFTISIVILGIYIALHPVKVENYKNVVCPTMNDSFEQKRFVTNEKCYKEGAISCKDIINFLKLPESVDGLNTEEYNAAISLLSANTYKNKDKSDPKIYNANECVLGYQDAVDLNIYGCRVGDVELKEGNVDDSSIEWAHGNGCVLSERNVRNDLGSVLKTIHDKFREAPVETQKNLRTRIKQNQDATAAHWSAYNDNNSNKDHQRREEQNAKDKDATATQNTVIEFTEEQRAAAAASALQPQADHNTIVDASMKRNCSMRWELYSPCPSCGTGAKEKWRTTVQWTAVNGGTACPAVQYTEYECGNVRPCIPPEINVPYNEAHGAIRSAEDERYCVDVDGRNGRDYRADHATVLNYPCRNPPTHAQLLWRGNANSLVFAPSQKCLDVLNWGGDGSDIIQYACHHGANQQWTYHTDQSLRPGHDKHLCLTRHGEGMRVFNCTGAGNQKWVFRT